MRKKLLLVNGFDQNYAYVPMGSFGLCDYLSHRGIESKIFNCSVYGRDAYLKNLFTTIDFFKPDCIGLIIHWKELLLNTVFLSKRIKLRFKNIPIIAGGFTAGFFAEEILQYVKYIDMVIKGDPERPILMLLRNSDPGSIPNLIFRKNGFIEASKKKYFVDSKTLCKMSFAGLSYLVDCKKYIEKIRLDYGFPIFIGEGCIHDCLYCGGSRGAFVKHSNRKNPVRRNVASIIKDLKKIAEYTDVIYIYYNFDVKFICDLFEAMLAEPDLVKRFRINFCTCTLMEKRVFDLYLKVGKFEVGQKTLIEISPHLPSDSHRKIIMGKSVYFSNRAWLKSIRMINSKLKDFVEIKLFFSRYHKTQNGHRSISLDLQRIHNLDEYLHKTPEFSNVFVKYGKVSTDPGSVYWDLFSKEQKNTSLLPRVLMYALQQRQHPISSSKEFCLYLSNRLERNKIIRYENLIKAMKLQ